MYDLLLHKEFSARRDGHPNPINRTSVLNGFAQFEEDSITLEILDRIGLRNGYFVEFGVGEGLENNTLEIKASYNGMDYNEGYAGLTKADFNADPYQRYVASQLDQMNSNAYTYYAKFRSDFNKNVSNNLTVYYNGFYRDWFKLDKVNGAPGAHHSVIPVRTNTCYLTVLLIEPEKFSQYRNDVSMWVSSITNMQINTSKYGRYNILRNQEFLLNMKQEWK